MTMQAVADDDGEARERRLVTVLRLHDQLGGVHAAPSMSAPASPGASKVYGSRRRLGDSICAMLPGNGVCGARR